MKYHRTTSELRESILIMDRLLKEEEKKDIGKMKKKLRDMRAKIKRSKEIQKWNDGEDCSTLEDEARALNAEIKSLEAKS